jgi:hypothetical protein
METGWQLLAESINTGRALAPDGNGLDGDRIRGPGPEVIAVLIQSRAQGADFETAYLKARRALLPPRTSGSRKLRASVAFDLHCLQELKPYLRAAYEGGQPLDFELAESREMCERRIDALLGVS